GSGPTPRATSAAWQSTPCIRSATSTACSWPTAPPPTCGRQVYSPRPTSPAPWGTCRPPSRPTRPSWPRRDPRHPARPRRAPASGYRGCLSRWSDMPPPRVHYLRSNETTWTPPSVISLDTETRIVQADPEVQALRCWHARADYRRGARRLPGEQAEGGGTGAQDLAARVDRWARKWDETWLYCHN